MGRRSCASLLSFAAILVLSTRQYKGQYSFLWTLQRHAYAAGYYGGVLRTIEGGEQQPNVDAERRGGMAASNESESDPESSPDERGQSSPEKAGAGDEVKNLLPPPVAIAIPTTRDGICENADTLARVSLNRQTSRPSRVILGISLGRTVMRRGENVAATSNILSPSELECIERFRSILDAPLTVETSNETASAGSSRNAALSALHPGEAVLMHDDDEYIHPHAVEFVRWTLARYPNADALIMGFLMGWGVRNGIGKSGWPWCRYTRLEERFLSVYTTTRVFKNPGSSNVHIEDPDAPPKPCGSIHHAYPVFRRRPADDFGIWYPNSKRRNEDGVFLQTLLDQNATVRYSCFPVVAYRSVIPDVNNSEREGPVVDDPEACPCFGGFSVCPKIRGALSKSQVKGLSHAGTGE